MSIKQEKKPIDRFLQDGASAGIWSLQITIETRDLTDPILDVGPAQGILRS